LGRRDRLPGLVVTNGGVVLAFAEGRVDSFKDGGDIDQVLRRSLDGGASWLPLQVLRDEGDATLSQVFQLMV